MTTVRLPPTVPPLFAGLARDVDVEAPTVGAAIEQLDERWPGLRDRLCEPGPRLRTHIKVFVDGEPASLQAPLAGDSHVDVIAAISGG